MNIQKKVLKKFLRKSSQKVSGLHFGGPQPTIFSHGLRFFGGTLSMILWRYNPDCLGGPTPYSYPVFTNPQLTSSGSSILFQKPSAWKLSSRSFNCLAQALLLPGSFHPGFGLPCSGTANRMPFPGNALVPFPGKSLVQARSSTMATRSMAVLTGSADCSVCERVALSYCQFSVCVCVCVSWRVYFFVCPGVSFHFCDLPC